MSFDGLLINTATIQRFSEGIADAYGRKAKTWVDDSTEDCRLFSAGGREIQVGAEVVIAGMGCFFKSTANITEQNRVIIGSITYEILLVEPFQDATGAHHQKAFLRTVR